MCVFFCKRKKSLDRLLIVENDVLIQNSDECPICLESLSSEQCVTTSCDHYFHKECINDYIHSETVRNSKEFRCPYCHKFQFIIK